MNLPFYRKALFISLILNSIALLFATRRIYYVYGKNEPPSTKMWTLDRKAIYNLFPINKDDIVFVGDSQVQLFDTEEFFPGLNIRNRGIGGDITNGVSQRIYDIAKAKPKVILLEVGTNDVYTQIAVNATIANMKNTIETIQKTSKDTKIYIVSVLPRSDGYHNQIQQINSGFERLGKSKSVCYINGFDEFSNNENLKREYDGGDGVHLSAKGYIKLKSILLKNCPYLQFSI